LISQVAKELSAIFGNTGLVAPEIVTVPTRPDTPVDPNAIYVMTQERLHITLQARPDFRVDLLIVDEAQSISEGGRGILLQSVIDELLLRNSHSQILFASPSTRNLDSFGRLFHRADIDPRHSKEPTVSQNFLITKRSEAGTISLTAVRENGRLAKIGEKASLPIFLSFFVQISQT
jgi:replicative superfamily II helicase